MAATLQQALDAARARFGPEHWTRLNPAEQTRIVYEEMRRIDLEQIRSRSCPV